MPSLIDKIDSLASAKKHVSGNYNPATGKIEYVVVPETHPSRKSSKPSKSYSSGSSLFSWGYSGANRDLRADEYGAAQAVAIVTEVQRAVQFWQQWLSGLTWHLYDGATDEILVSSTDRKPKAGNGALWFQAVKRFPENWKHDFFESIAFSDWVWGETYIGKLRNQVQVADFMWLNPLGTEPDIMQGRIRGYRYSGDEGYYLLDVNEVAYRIAQRNPLDDWRGLSPVLNAIDKINLTENVHRSLNGYYRRHMMLGGVVSPKGDMDIIGTTMNKLEEKMTRNHQGAVNAFGWFFNEAPVEIQQFQPLDIEKNYTIVEPLRKQIAHAMGVPPVLSGDPTEVNYDNADKVMRNWWQTDGIPYARKVANFVNRQLLPDVEPNTDIYFGFDFTDFEIETPDVVTADFNAGYIDYTVSQSKRGHEVDEGLKGIYMVGGKPMHRDIIIKIANQLPPEYQQAAQPMTPDAPALPQAGTPEALPVVADEPTDAPLEPKKKYDPNQPRDGNGQFGSGGGSSGGGSDSGGGKKPKPEKPKRGKPDWNKKPNRVGGKDKDGYQDYGHVIRNPKNGDSNAQIRAMSDSHVANLDKKQQNAVTTYTGDSFRDINGGLRGDGKLSATHQRTVDNLDSALAKNSLSEDTILYRGMRSSPELSQQLVPGATFTDRAYTSATFDQAMGDSFSNGVLMRIKAPAGTNGMSVASISNFPPESEFLLPRNTSYRITGVYQDRGQTYVDAEIVTDGNKIKFIVSRLLYNRKQAVNPPPSEDDRSDKFNWGVDDIIFDEPETSEDDENEDDSEDTDTGKHVHIEGHTLAVETWDYAPDKARKELVVWQKHVKSGSKRPFEPLYTRGDIADSVIAGIAENAEITAIFDTAFALLPQGIETLKTAFISVFEALENNDSDTATKSLQSIRLDFEGRFEDVLRDIRSGNIDNRRRAGDILRQIIRTFGYRAYVQGLADGGVEDTPSEDDEAAIASLRSEQSSYISNLTSVLIREDGITDTQAAGKADMWWNKSIVPFYQAGLASANANGLYEWVYGDTEHCSDCLRLNGQRHRLKHWKGKGWLPQAKKLECGGYHCQCKLIPVAGKARGKF